MRIEPAEFQALDLEVHAFLEGVPLHDVSAIDLPGGGPDRKVGELRELMSLGHMGEGSAPLRFLFALRAFLGRGFGWDGDAHAHPEESSVHRLSDAQRARSLRPPGSADGPFRLVYEFPREMLAEVRNATVHAFSCMALQPTESGTRFYWAIYVIPTSRLTPVYMALIEPFRRFIVYPSILRRLRTAWETKWGPPEA